MKKELSVNFDIGFADSTIKSYSVEDENLKVLLECWNSDLVEIKFLELVSLFALNYFRIADLREVFQSALLDSALIDLYEKKPDEHDFRIFKFLNSDGMTALEIVCKSVEIKKV